MPSPAAPRPKTGDSQLDLILNRLIARIVELEKRLAALEARSTS